MGAAQRRPWRFHEEFMDLDLGLNPTGTLFIGKEVWEFVHQGTTGSTNTTVPIPLPAGTQMDQPIPGGIHVMISPAPGVYLDGASIDSADLQVTVLAGVPQAGLQTSLTFDAKDFSLIVQFTVSPA